MVYYFGAIFSKETFVSFLKFLKKVSQPPPSCLLSGRLSWSVWFLSYKQFLTVLYADKKWKNETVSIVQAILLEVLAELYISKLKLCYPAGPVDHCWFKLAFYCFIPWLNDQWDKICPKLTARCSPWKRQSTINWLKLQPKWETHCYI